MNATTALAGKTINNSQVISPKKKIVSNDLAIRVITLELEAALKVQNEIWFRLCVLSTYQLENSLGRLPGLSWPPDQKFSYPATWHSCQVIKMTKHCTKSLGVVNLWPARSPDFVPENLTMTNIVYIAPSDPMISIDHPIIIWLFVKFSAHESQLVCHIPLPNPHHKKTLCQILSGG